MDSKAIIFSAIALLGTGGLLWAGFGGAGGAFGEHERHEHEHHYQERGDHHFNHEEHEQVRQLQQQGDILPLEQILERARQHHQGRILEADLKRRHDRYVYKVELVDEQGQVWEMKLDAMSGELLREEREN